MLRRVFNVRALALAFSLSVVGSHAYADASVALSNVYACPLFVSTTSVSNTNSIPFHFKFQWTIVTVGTATPATDEATCCSYTKQRVIAAPTDAPSSIYTYHYLNPAEDEEPGEAPAYLIKELEAVCPDYTGSGQIDTSSCDTKLTHGNCFMTAAFQTTSSSDQAVALDHLNDRENVALALTPEKPLRVESQIIPDRAAVLRSLQGWEKSSLAGTYRPLTTVANALAAQGCTRVQYSTLLLEDGSRTASMLYDCKADYVVAREALHKGAGSVRATEGAAPFKLDGGSEVVAQYLEDNAGRRKSTLSWVGTPVVLSVSLYHEGQSEAEWLKALVSSMTISDTAL